MTPPADDAVSTAGEGGVSGGGAEPAVTPEGGDAASLEGEALPPSGSTAPAEMT